MSINNLSKKEIIDQLQMAEYQRDLHETEFSEYTSLL